jgi:putative transposase
MPVQGRDRPNKQRKTCRRYNDPGHAHALTFSCFQRQPFLNRNRTRRWLRDAIALACRKHTCDLWAYVIMPEHAHLLVYPTAEAYSISKFLTTVKQSVAKRARLFVLETAPSFLAKMTDVRPNGRAVFRFWQRGGGYDRNLWSPKHIWETIDYIHANPVRRELCNTPEDWTWSSARTHAGLASDPLPIDFDTIPEDPRPGQSRR